MEARRNGAKLYTIDPRRNRTGAAADKHFFINPGSDTALAFAMMHVILGEGLEDRDYIEQYTSGIEELRERVRDWTPGARGRTHRDRRRGDCRTGTRVRHHAARSDSPELRRAAQRARCDGGADNRVPARTHRIVERYRRRDCSSRLRRDFK